MREAERTVISYICDRERAVVWGIEGGLPSMPHGLTLTREAPTPRMARLHLLRRAESAPATCSAGRPPAAAASAIRWSAIRLVLEDVADDYVSVERAAKDYGVVIKVIDAELCEYEVDEAATRSSRDVDPAGPRLLARNRSREGRRRFPRRQNRQARRGAPLRCRARMGQGPSSADIHCPVPRDVSQALGREMACRIFTS